MKKYYYITIIASIAILCLQANYTIGLYNNYINEKIIEASADLRIAIDKERILRSNIGEGRKSDELQYLKIKSISAMSPDEIDSLKRISPVEEALSIDGEYDIDEARNRELGNTSAELMSQLAQDALLIKGIPLNLHTLDSLFAEIHKEGCQHRLFIYNESKIAIDSIGNLTRRKSNYIGEFLPIGTKGLMYLQLQMIVPFSHFILLHLWTLCLSVIFMVIALLSLMYQLMVIHKKNSLLKKREDNINGTIHDLKAPLNSVLTTLGWLQSDETNLPKKKAVEISRAEVRHLVCNIESLLVTVRKDKKKLVLKKEEIDILHLTEMVKYSMDALYRIKPHTIEIVDELPVEVKVIADGLYIENVIRNLVENALKYSDNGVVVKVILSVVNDVMQVSVQDNGWGIPAQYQKKLFQQFYQVPRGEKRICKGYGIGLAQSKYIIDEHKGKIKVESVEEKGSIFTFTIPLV